MYYSKWDGKNGSHDLLEQAAAKWCAAHQMPEISQFILCREETWKKPYFEYPRGVEFSISHTGNIWMCAVADAAVGLDVQEANRCNRDKLSKRFFHPKEDAWLNRHQYSGFFHIWAAKESYLKYSGVGLSYGMDGFCVIEEDGFAREIDGISQRHFVCSLEKDEKDGCLEEGLPEEAFDWSFEEYFPDSKLDIQPNQDRLAVCVSFQGEWEIYFQRL